VGSLLTGMVRLCWPTAFGTAVVYLLHKAHAALPSDDPALAPWKALVDQHLIWAAFLLGMGCMYMQVRTVYPHGPLEPSHQD
jgi:hypothetical protein